MLAYIVGLIWTIMYVSLETPLSLTLTIILTLCGVVILLYNAVCWWMFVQVRRDTLPDVLTKKIREDHEFGPLVIDGTFAVILFFILFPFAQTGTSSFTNLLFLTAGFISITTFCELTLHVFLEYSEIIKSLNR